MSFFFQQYFFNLREKLHDFIIPDLQEVEIVYTTISTDETKMITPLYKSFVSHLIICMAHCEVTNTQYYFMK